MSVANNGQKPIYASKVHRFVYVVFSLVSFSVAFSTPLDPLFEGARSLNNNSVIIKLRYCLLNNVHLTRVLKQRPMLEFNVI